MTTSADWAGSLRGLLDALRPPAASSTGAASSTDAGVTAEDPPAHGADCRWCPICQTAAVLRGERPEVTAALADVLTTTASALRDLAGEPPQPRGHAEAADTSGQHDDRNGGRGPGAVQRIDIT